VLIEQLSGFHPRIFSLGIWDGYLNRQEKGLAADLVAKRLLDRSYVPDINTRLWSRVLNAGKSCGEKRRPVSR
jgi:hypothetical protein